MTVRNTIIINARLNATVARKELMKLGSKARNTTALMAKKIEPTIFQMVAIVPIDSPTLCGSIASLTAVIIAVLLRP